MLIASVRPAGDRCGVDAEPASGDVRGMTAVVGRGPGAPFSCIWKPCHWWHSAPRGSFQSRDALTNFRPRLRGATTSVPIALAGTRTTLSDLIGQSPGARHSLQAPNVNADRMEHHAVAVYRNIQRAEKEIPPSPIGRGDEQ